MTNSPAPPSGFRDFPPPAQALRLRAIETITRVYSSFGFAPIGTSCVEDLHVLQNKGGGENEKLIFKILKRGDKLDLAQGPAELADLGLRFDLTLPLARFYSRHQGILPHPFKALQIGPVWRAERAQKGRYREFVQCDADILGSEHWSCEVEVAQAMVAALTAAGLEPPTVLFNDRRLLTALLDRAGIPAPTRSAAFIALDKLDKTSPEAVFGELETSVGVGPAKILRESVLSTEPDPRLLAQACPEAARGLDHILGALRGLFGAPERFRLAPSLVRGFDYYTGPVFELRAAGLSGSIGGGGRYDGLTGQFAGKAVGACGGSIGFERLMLLLEERSAARPAGPDVVVTVFAEELRARSWEAAAALRRAGLSADVYPGHKGLGAQFKYADSKGAAYAAVIGPDEAAAGKVKLKELATGSERLVAADGLAEALRRKP